ncbi:MAG: hypothetical protein M3Z19_09475, partial [Chloroflexota bacterium]|nr:hypothetical protein [Chloroflexota bacterium]
SPGDADSRHTKEHDGCGPIIRTKFARLDIVQKSASPYDRFDERMPRWRRMDRRARTECSSGSFIGWM